MDAPEEDFLPTMIDVLGRLRSTSAQRGHPMLASLLDMARGEAEDTLKHEAAVARARARFKANAPLLPARAAPVAEASVAPVPVASPEQPAVAAEAMAAEPENPLSADADAEQAAAEVPLPTTSPAQGPIIVPVAALPDAVLADAAVLPPPALPREDGQELERAIEAAFLAATALKAPRKGATIVDAAPPPVEPPRPPRRNLMRRTREWRSAAASLPQF